MKCQRCPKPATRHITEVLGDDKFEELHLCEECAKKYLYEPEPKKTVVGKSNPVIESESNIDPGAKQCAVCGIKFVEFRNTGRLGCPHDYDEFREELLPLLESIHGDMKHLGKMPRRKPHTRSTGLELIQLRKQLQSAVSEEDYEEAARLRDRIKQLEEHE